LSFGLSRLKMTILTAVGLVVILVLTLALFGLPVGASLKLMLEGAAGDKYGISRTLVVTTPLLLAALGMVVAWKAGMYNIGGEGQYIMGGLSGALTAKMFAGAPPVVLTVAILLSSLIGGGLYAALAGWLHVHRGILIFISTILLNFIALQILSYAVSGPLQEATRKVPQSDPLPAEVMLPRFDRTMDLHAGIFFCVLACVAVHVYLFLSKGGFKLRLVGENPRTARANRIDIGKVQLLAMTISGALCGFAGGVQYTGVQRELSTSFSENWGFIAIPVALLGGLHPLGVALSAVYFGALFAGAKNLERFTPAAGPMVYVIQALAVLALVALQTAAKRKQVHEESQ
jgi:general nucleoside transport system permease protein